VNLNPGSQRNGKEKKKLMNKRRKKKIKTRFRMGDQKIKVAKLFKDS
jgi:hypothetical protein